MTRITDRTTTELAHRFTAAHELADLEDRANDHVHGCAGRLAIVLEVFTEEATTPAELDEPGELWLLLDDAADDYDRDPLGWADAHDYTNVVSQHRAEPIEADDQ